MKEEQKPIVAITMGDAAGIGPEIIVKALLTDVAWAVCRPLVVGDAATMQKAVELVKAPLKVHPVQSESEAVFQRDTIDVLDLKNIDLAKLEPRKVQAMCGKAAYEYVEQAIQLALAQRVGAIATAPLNKEALNAGGYHYPGHTEILAALTETPHVAMMLAAGNFRVAHVTTHVSLRQAIELINRERVVTVINLAHEATRRMGVESPRIAVAGLNPHAGERGMFGTEEIEEITPAVEEAKALGYQIVGPLPPDSVFFRAKQGQFDCVIAMYHDQGHIPLKTVGFDEGINVTLGLPIIRTSVDHGTAMGHSWSGTARPQSMIESIKWAGIMAQQR